MQSQIGLIGLGTMGAALARNLGKNGFRVSVWNRTQEKVTEFVDDYGAQPDGAFYSPQNFEDFVESLESPRKVIVMVPAGKPFQAVLQQLVPALEKGDAIMNGGNEIFRVTEVLEAKLNEQGIHYLGAGISGGEEGALRGPSIMPGGTQQAYQLFEPVLSAIAAEDFQGRACVAYMGRGGAGHYVKMVHNGIEYAEMQMLAEAYDMLKTLYKLGNEEIAEIFAAWDEGRLSSFLTEISVDVLQKKEEGQPLLDLILDRAGQKGTGQWTSQEALALGVAAPAITGAVYMRYMSADKELRTQLSQDYPTLDAVPNMLVSEFAEHLEKALFAARIANFEQGFALLRAASMEYKYDLNFSEIARIWQGGCIIRSALLRDIQEFYASASGADAAANAASADSLYKSDFAHKAIVDAQKSWRTVVQLAIEHSIPMIAISGSLTHFEAYRHGRLPANFIQGLRDRFGSHGYERTDKEGSFNSMWP